MHSVALPLIELGALLFGLGILGRLAGRLGISPVPLYLVGGLAFGTGGLLPLEGIEPFTDVASEVGVVLLLLLLGLEYSASELVSGLRRSWQAGIVDMVLNGAPGAIAALVLGWGPLGALAMAGVTWVSSSGIVAKVLADLGRLGNRETPAVLSVLVMEDLAMALYLPITIAALAALGWATGLRTVLIAVLLLAVVLVVALRYGRMVSALVESPTSEVFLLRVFGLALLVAGVASQLQVSAGVGAFLLGIASSEDTAENAARVLTPLRDLFAAVFFVVFGLNTDPAQVPAVLPAAIVLVVVSTVTKIAAGWFAARQIGVGPLGRWRAGAALVARGEFSIVIAGLALTTGAVDPGLAPLATTYVLLMAILGPVAARVVEPVHAGLIRRWQPAAS
ncbi:MAG TPA: cation:proton antiporter [Actinomycetospora sp.]|nr:cation:proton antiporter [Actinomycetospora sp.]